MRVGLGNLKSALLPFLTSRVDALCDLATETVFLSLITLGRGDYWTPLLSGVMTDGNIMFM